MDHILTGMTPEMREAVRVDDPQTVEELHTLAKRVEAMSKNSTADSRMLLIDATAHLDQKLNMLIMQSSEAGGDPDQPQQQEQENNGTSVEQSAPASGNRGRDRGRRRGCGGRGRGGQQYVCEMCSYLLNNFGYINSKDY